MPQRLPEAARIHDGQRRGAFQFQQIAIPRDEDIRPRDQSGGNDPSVVGIADWGSGGSGRPWDDFLIPEELNDLTNRPAREPEFPAQSLLEFGQDDFPCHQGVLREHVPQDIGAQSASGECRDENVGVEEDPHEMSRITSSSVR